MLWDGLRKSNFGKYVILTFRVIDKKSKNARENQYIHFARLKMELSQERHGKYSSNVQGLPL